MGFHPNITNNKFPVQNDDLGKLVTVELAGVSTDAIVVRSDAESPMVRIMKSLDGTYFQEDEAQNFSFPKQIEGYDFAEVLFHYNTEFKFPAKIVRMDSEAPHISMFELENNRIVMAHECQWAPVFKDENPKEKVERVNNYVEGAKNRLSKLPKSKRADYLHGIYKQIIPGPKGKRTNGKYNALVNAAGCSIMSGRIEELATQIVKQVELKEFAEYLSNELNRYDHLKNHASKVDNKYSDGPMKLNVSSQSTTTLN